MGSVVISVDAALGWGVHHQSSPPTDRVERARWGWKRLVSLFDRYDVPATWAVVGHLLLETCDGRHEDHPAGPEWFSRERGTWEDRPELRFAHDLVDQLRSATVDHDIGFHSFSNVDFTAAATTREVAAAELQRCRRLADQYRLSAPSVTFPGNNVAHRGLLATHGFRCYRGGRSPDGGSLRKLGEAAGLPARSRLVDPSIDEYGLVRVPPSLSLFGYEGWKRRVTAPLLGDPIVAAARNGIDAATNRDGVFHMWLRPMDVTGQRDVDRLVDIFEYLDERRTDLDIDTMADVAVGAQQSDRVTVTP
jgi:peptidoglycan/xylan/chitin deacetylase (PgdA/CDA1 family)